MNPGELLAWLEAHDACTEAREWVAGKTLREAWDECVATAWIDWFLGVVGLPRDTLWTQYLTDERHDLWYCDFIHSRISYETILEAMKRGS